MLKSTADANKMSLKSGMVSTFPMAQHTTEHNLHPAVNSLHWLIFGAIMLVPLHYASKALPSGYVQDLFNLGKEANLPTFFACFCWSIVAASSVVAFFADQVAKPLSKTRWIWLFIAAAFFFASLDEFVQLHEHTLEIFQFIKGNSGAASGRTLDWNVLYTPPMLLLAGIGGSFAWSRMKGLRQARIYLIAGITCLALAIGAEYLQAAPTILALIQQNEFMKQSHFLWVLEETLENLGAVFLAIAITRYGNSSIKQLLAEATATAGREEHEAVTRL